MELNNPVLDDYILSQCHAANPKICLIPTASGDNMELTESFYDFFMTRRCIPSHLSLHNPATRDIEGFIMENDILYVTGGHTGRMLMSWKAFNVDVIIRKAWEAGILLAGVSAGATCWFQVGLTDSNPEGISPERCLGFLKGSHCSHYELEGRRPTFQRLIREGVMPPGYGTENFAALHFIGHKLKHVVSSRPGATSCLVAPENGEITETRLPVHELQKK